MITVGNDLFPIPHLDIFYDIINYNIMHNIDYR